MSPELDSLTVIRFRRQQDLNTEISLEIGLIAACGFEASPGHEQENDRAVDFVAAPNVEAGLVEGGMERALVVEFHVAFELRSEIVADYQAGEPAVRPFVDRRVTEFEIHADGAEFLRELKRQQESIAGGSDPTPHGVVGIIEEELRENRDLQPGLSSVVESPLDSRIRLTESEPGFRKIGILHAQPCVFVSELDALAHAKIDVDVRGVGDGLIAVEKRHVAKIDFPVEGTGRPGIVRVIGRAALGAAVSRTKHKETQKK